MLISNNFDTTKNPKLVPNWKGPGGIIDINDTNAKIKFKNKVKVLNVAKLNISSKMSKNLRIMREMPHNLINILIKTMTKR